MREIKSTQGKLLGRLEHMFKAWEYSYINISKNPPSDGKQVLRQIKKIVKEHFE